MMHRLEEARQRSSAKQPYLDVAIPYHKYMKSIVYY